MTRNVSIIIVLALVILGGVVLWNINSGPTISDQNISNSISTDGPLSAQTVATNLDTPWNIIFLPNGNMLVSERKGTLRVIGDNPQTIQVPGVAERGEGGHLGIAIHPEYESNNLLYIYLTTEEGGNRFNQVVQYVFNGSSLADPKVIISGIPASNNHNGGAIAFGPDGYLYITTGDAGSEELSQNKNSLAGKILRVRGDGIIPEDNPFGNAVYSYGHRNPQGLAWDEAGGLWSTEHGRSGLQSGYDEINHIEKGANYGWPLIQGDEVRDGMKAPALHSGPTTTWAPAGLAYRDGSLYFGGLRGEALYEVPVNSAGVNSPGNLGSLMEHFKNELGRLRAVAVNSAGQLFVSTSNHDGRGNPAPDDDRIINIVSDNT